jgi:hypothetical protein
MKTLVNQVRQLSAKSKLAGHSRDFLDYSLNDPGCQRIIQRLNEVDVRSLGVTGTNSAEDAYHFAGNLNRVEIDANEDYRLVVFFIKKGTVMPLHDHPNMSVYFKLMFGKLQYSTFDKVDSKY